jgi:hypothetical protein
MLETASTGHDQLQLEAGWLSYSELKLIHSGVLESLKGQLLVVCAITLLLCDGIRIKMGFHSSPEPRN